jgi:nucleoside-diphosphate-sugar epimerase
MKHPLQSDLDHVLEYTPGIWETLRGSRVFITGGTGFVGTWLLESLLWADHQMNSGIEAVVLTRDPDAFATREPWVARHKAVKLQRGDTQTFSFPEGTFDYLIHAATANYGVTEPELVRCVDADITGTRRVLEFASKAQIQRMLFTSSGAVYGRQPTTLPRITEDYPGAPLTTDPKGAYGHAKRVSEFLCTMYSLQYGFAATIARLFAFVGPRLPLTANFAVGNFIRDAISGGPIRIRGDGTSVRSYLYAADLAIWLWTVLVRGESRRPYNVGSSDEIDIRELARVVVDTTGSDTKIYVTGTPLPGTIADRYVPSVERARTELGLKPIVPLPEGIRRTYMWAGTQWQPYAVVHRP